MLRNILKLSASKCLVQKTNVFHTTRTITKSFRKWYRNLWIPKSAVEPPYSHVTQIGDPVLRQICDPVPEEYFKSKELGFILDRMIFVLKHFDCVGLSAPQVGINLRIIVMEFGEKLRNEFPSSVYKTKQMSTLPLIVFINPQLKVKNFNKNCFLESCASVRGYAAEVERYEEISLTGFDQNGVEQILELSGWNARIAQHEMDHLDGRVYTDIMDRFTFECTCWPTVNAQAGRVEIPFGPSK